MTLMFAHGKDRHEVAVNLTSKVANISYWHTYLTLNVS